MALHTDGDHPHVHVLLKALGEDGMRLNVRKATLRSWRAQFAENLRQLGVAANATERTVRGQVLASKRDRIYRAAKRGESTYGAAQERRAVGNPGRQRGPSTFRMEEMQRTRAAVVEGWKQTASNLRATGDHELADQIRTFRESLPPMMLERVWLTEQMPQRARPTSRDPERTR